MNPDELIDITQKGIPNVPPECRPQGCANCPFPGGMKVGSRGPKDSPFVIVGESPGSNELMKGYPFVGDSGEMLQETLKRVGLTDEDPQPYIINAMQCLPRNKEPAIMAAACRSCHQRLHDEIAAHPRKVILALGNSAAWSTTNNYGLKITQERGKLFPSILSQYGVVTTVHPAFLMRQGTMYGPWKRDLAYAVALLKGTDTKEGLWKPPTWGTVESRDDFVALLHGIAGAKYIAGDIETGGAKKAGLHFQRGYILELVICTDVDEGSHVHVLPGKLLWDNEDLTRQLLGHPAKWIWQNGKFDVKFFRYEGITEARVDEDTMLLSYTLNENKGHDLDLIAWDWIGADKHKSVIDEWFKAHGISKEKVDYALIPTDIRHRYAAYDVSKTYHMFWPLREAVAMDPHCEKLYTRILIPASEFLAHMEMKGMEIDPERVRENDAYLEEKLKEPEAAIQKYAVQYLGHEINVGSPMQLGDLLYRAMKLGAVGSSTDDDHLIKISRRFDHPIALDIMRWRTISKARNTYVRYVFGQAKSPGRAERQPWMGLDGRVHVTFKIHGTSTGRLSSSDPTNLQNWPRDPQIRGEFVAGKGKVLIECDLNQAELRCLAIMSADPTLLEIYTRNEVSIHHITSVAMFGEKYTDDEKMRAKAVNFGIVYGRTAPSIAEEFNISVREAEEYIRIWLERFPKAKVFIQQCRDAPTNMRTLITNFGRKKRWGVISYDNQQPSENEAANFPHQSSAHDITLLSGIECRPIIKELWTADFVNEIHDALYSEAWNDPELYGPMIAYIQHVMQRTPLDWGLNRVPFLAEAKVGYRWGAKSGAKQAGITDEAQLAEYMTGFSPTEEHKETAMRMLRDTLGLKVTF